jgi:RNA polymerase sigma-70 factor (ECF subfamily)
MNAEEKMIAGCRDGKRRAQSDLYQRFASGMFGVCLRYSRSREEAEDILQEGFLKVFGRISQYTGKGSFEGWIRRIMVNTAINHYHASLKQQFILVENIQELAVEEDQSAQDFGQDSGGAGIDTKRLLNLVQELPDGYRMVLNLHVFEGYNHKEIGEMLGISDNTSKSQLSKARKYLKKLLFQTEMKENKVLSSYEK